MTSFSINITNHGYDMRDVAAAIGAWNSWHPHPYLSVDLGQDEDGTQHLILTPKKLVHRLIEAPNCYFRNLPSGEVEILPLRQQPAPGVVQHLYPKACYSVEDVIVICAKEGLWMEDENAAWWVLKEFIGD